MRGVSLTGEHGAWWPDLDGDTGHVINARSGEAWLEPVDGVPGTWVQLGPDPSAAGTRPARARAAAAVLAAHYGSEREAGQVAQELAGRYEEINLLYTISEVLGRTVRLEEAARVIVKEVSDVVGARRASIMAFDPGAEVLRVVAGRGLEVSQLGPVSVDDDCSVAARVFRDSAPISYDPREELPSPGCPSGRTYRGESFLSVPILYAGAGGPPRPVGVINLTDRLGEDAFSAGDQKLVTAIASQVGAAIENARLVAEERSRERLSTELELAHHLQLALLPGPSLLASAGDVGARCQPAESVGGDFYKLIPLGGRKMGVLIGDVSSHGIGAALLMANAISAATVVAQAAATPQEALHRLLGVMGDELARTEMFISLFYGVVDSDQGVLRYANAGHPYAFLLPVDGSDARRLRATAPPFGLAPGGVIGGAQCPWRSREDLLCLFTDGLTESRSPAGQGYGEKRLLDTVRRHERRPCPEIVDAVFRDVSEFCGHVTQDDRTLVLLRG
ncbi:MAG TPA: GAF domain-containing SpoIIE family protein phosphatase [Gemmatimonadales bacterium]|nr:GAF domain-containing SpoIIE family protein phosphatase [Gemmatimonadales bacterium]